MLSFRLPGALWLRLAARQFLGLLFHDPPRSTRDTFQAAPQAEACARSMRPQYAPTDAAKQKNFSPLRGEQCSACRRNSVQ